MFLAKVVIFLSFSICFIKLLSSVFLFVNTVTVKTPYSIPYNIFQPLLKS